MGRKPWTERNSAEGKSVCLKNKRLHQLLRRWGSPPHSPMAWPGIPGTHQAARWPHWLDQPQPNQDSECARYLVRVRVLQVLVGEWGKCMQKVSFSFTSSVAAKTESVPSIAPNLFHLGAGCLFHNHR